MIPAAEAFGARWALLHQEPAVEDLNAAFRDAGYAVYGGPEGARVVVSVFLVAEGMTAIRDSWEIGNNAFDSYRSEIDYAYQSSRERDLAERAAPEGCADTRRIYGVDTIGLATFPVGITLCAADPEVMVLAYASGTVAGLTGYEASDAVVAAVLGGGEGTPTP